ncbi:unnamed protein product [Danaus chrysippus]|uniref:(African queen) hypothetical protein n=1 Tax=Danaus chrysippus TaxID=151541 RepID=A0A8J2QYJ5_9NEOP|nr:unnamed protein product [Danaus chrysippus]
MLAQDAALRDVLHGGSYADSIVAWSPKQWSKMDPKKIKLPDLLEYLKQDYLGALLNFASKSLVGIRATNDASDMECEFAGFSYTLTCLTLSGQNGPK